MSSKSKFAAKGIEVITFLVLMVSIFWLKEINYLFYDILESPDFDKYYIYLEHFFNGELTKKEHGLMYYYLHSLYYSFSFSDLLNFDINLDKSIQQVNFYIYLFGLFGYYVLLRFHKFSRSVIFGVLTFINFFPPAISMRLVFKPEILAFALFPWIIYLIEKFKKENKVRYLYLAIPLTLSAVTQKGNILAIVSLILILFYLRTFLKAGRMHILMMLLLSLFSFYILSEENNAANGKNLLDLQSGSEIEENYNFKAPYSIIYNLDLFNLVSKPEKPNHANSFIGVTLLETSGDYFDLIWNNDASNFYKSRRIIFETEVSKEIKSPEFNEADSTFIIFKQRDSDRYPRKTTGLILSLFLYFYLLRMLVLNKELRSYLLFLFIGMAVLLFHAISGLPKNNFDPLVGDTFKPMYYSFAMIFSFAFLVAIYLRKGMGRYISIIIYSMLIIFILGFPKTYDYDIQVNLVPKIQQSTYCDFEKELFLENSEFTDIECMGSQSKFVEDDAQVNNINHKPVNIVLIVTNLLVVIYIFAERVDLSLLNSTRLYKRRKSKV